MLITPEQKQELSKKRWSYSSLSNFESCPYSFYRLYCLKDRPELPNTFFGQALHKIAENIKNQKRFNIDTILAEYKVPQMDHSRFKFSCDNLRTFINTKIIGTKNYSELELGVNIEDHKFMSILDIVKWVDRNTIHIYDLKSSKTANYSKEYKFQSKVFTYVLRTIYPNKHIKFFLYYPTPDKIIEMEIKESQDQIKTTLLQKVNEILACDDFKPTPHKWCKSCAYLKQKTCEAFS
jgi:CRISPR/Cas system-associated exonuclease Cas4 (RecB family)